MKHLISMSVCVCLLVMVLVPSGALKVDAAPLPEKITPPGKLQRTDCISPGEETEDDFVPYIEEFVLTDERAGISLYSCVNWRDGVLKSEGVGKQRSRRAAELVARSNALKTLIALNVTADATLQTYLQNRKDVNLKIQNVLIKNAEIQELPADPEKPDEARVLVTIPFYGISGLVSFFLDDQEIYLAQPAAPTSSSQATDDTAYTGILIDATGLELEPALFPQILSADGEVLYSASQVDKDILVEQGVLEYVYEQVPTIAWRAGDHPLVIRPVLLASADSSVPLPITPKSSVLPEGWQLFVEVRTRGGRGRANALTVSAAEAEGQHPVNVVVSVEDAQKIKQANAGQQVNQQGNYTVLIGREVGGVQGLLAPGLFARR